MFLHVLEIFLTISLSTPQGAASVVLLIGVYLVDLDRLLGRCLCGFITVSIRILSSEFFAVCYSANPPCLPLFLN